MRMRYLVCCKQFASNDNFIIGELISTLEENQEYIYKERFSGKIVNTGKKITRIFNTHYKNADVHLLLDDNTIVNLVVW